MYSSSKICTYEQAQEIITKWQEEGKLVVYLSGGFDVPHEGHVMTLEEMYEFAKQLAQELGKNGFRIVVAVESDGTLRLNKGELRPIFPAEKRVKVLAAFYFPDLVFAYTDVVSYESGQDIYRKRFKDLHPDAVFMTVGEGNWREKKEFLESLGLRVGIKNIGETPTSSQIIDKLAKEVIQRLIQHSS